MMDSEKNNKTNKELKGRKKYKFPHKKIRELMNGSVYFKCPFCGMINDAVERSLCKHVVYGYETVNYETIIKNDAFYRVFLKLLQPDPHYYIEDFDSYLDEYLTENEFENGENSQIDLDKLEAILEDKISPDVLEALIKEYGIPISMKSLTEYSGVDVCMGGTYYFLISDVDLEKIND